MPRYGPNQRHTPTQIDHYQEDPPIGRGPVVGRHNLIEDGSCPDCGKTDTFTVIGKPGARVRVRLACGHHAIWTVI